MANFLLNLAGVVTSVAIPLADLAKEQSGASTSFTIEIGLNLTGDFNAGGSIPHVAFWDIFGNRIGQYKGDRNGHVNQGDEKNFIIPNDQTVPKGKLAEPEYISVGKSVAQAPGLHVVAATLSSPENGLA